MRIHEVNIRRFRGINELDWVLPSAFVCLIGPRDSTKSTILDAIEYVLSPRWSVVFDDTDFFNLDTSQQIEITVTLGEVPESLLEEEKFGLLLRGWDPVKQLLNDEPDPAGDNQKVLSVRLTVDSTLEPQWNVVNDRNEGKKISHKDRELLGLARLGPSVDWHLSWRRGSILSRITTGASKGVEGIAGLLADATRAARRTFDPSQVETLRNAAGRTEILGKELGVLPRSQYQPHLDFESASVGMGGVTLHDGDIPLRRAGLGTRRLLTLALQKELARTGGVTLIDELEHGLEPHTIRQLLTFLKSPAEIKNKSKDAQPEEPVAESVLLTTHSPTVVVEVDAANLFIVRSRSGQTSVQSIPAELQNIVRTGPDAFLGKRVIVCEGKTELGFCRALNSWWSSQSGGLRKNSFALLGVVPIASQAGGGSEAPNIAHGFATLGFGTALLADSDKPLSPSEQDLMNAGVEVVQWDDSYSIEQRVFADLPWFGAAELAKIAVEEKSDESVRSAVAERLNINPAALTADIGAWNTISGIGEQKLRVALGEASKANSRNGRPGWFKRIDLGEKLGRVVVAHLDSIPTTTLAKKIATLRLWIDSGG